HTAGARVLDHDELLDALTWLQADHELVCRNIARALLEDRMRDRLELDDDFRHTLGKSLSGPQVKGHAGPTPVLDLGLDRYEGFRFAFFAQFVGIGLDRPAGR